jgi:DinB superfamily
MNVKDALKTALNGNHKLLTTYLSDFSDAELLVRPVPGANHAAWQLGHVISAEVMFLGMIPRAKPPALPAGFAERYTKDTAAKDETAGFLTKAEYLRLFGQVREATLTGLANLTEAELDTPVKGDMARFAPNIGALFLGMASHELMHAAQFTVTRRKLGKPLLM